MQDFTFPLILVIAFVAAAALAQTLLGTVLSAQAKKQRVNRRLTLLDQGLDHKQVYEALVRKRAIAPNLGNASLTSYYNAAVKYLTQANLQASPFAVIALWLGVSVGVWLIATTLMRVFGGSLSTAETGMSLFGAAGLVGNGIWMWISTRRRKRMRILEEQIPLALDIVIRSLRAGHPVVTALQLVTAEMGDPIGSEFGLVVDETTYGFELREALTNFARRTGSDDAHFFAVSVAIQSETGGNLSEILENLSRVIRARITLGKRVKALSSEGRMSGWILSVLPLLLISFLGLTQPNFYVSKFSDPIFWPTVLGIVGLYITGLMMMHRITNFKY